MGRRMKDTGPLYGAVVIYNDRECYSSFNKDLEKLIGYAESYGHGIIRIEEAHAKKPPVWVRPPEA